MPWRHIGSHADAQGWNDMNNVSHLVNHLHVTVSLFTQMRGNSIKPPQEGYIRLHLQKPQARSISQCIIESVMHIMGVWQNMLHALWMLSGDMTPEFFFPPAGSSSGEISSITGWDRRDVHMNHQSIAQVGNSQGMRTFTPPIVTTHQLQIPESRHQFSRTHISYKQQCFEETPRREVMECIRGEEPRVTAQVWLLILWGTNSGMILDLQMQSSINNSRWSKSEDKYTVKCSLMKNIWSDQGKATQARIRKSKKYEPSRFTGGSEA